MTYQQNQNNFRFNVKIFVLILYLPIFFWLGLYDVSLKDGFEIMIINKILKELLNAHAELNQNNDCLISLLTKLNLVMYIFYISAYFLGYRRSLGIT